MTETTLAITVAAIVFGAALVSSVAGFAFSALAGAALLHVLEDPVRTVGVMVTCSLAIQGYAVWSLRRAIRWRALLPYVGGGLPTVPLGVWLLTHAPAAAFAAALGSLLSAYGVYLLGRGDPPAHA